MTRARFLASLLVLPFLTQCGRTAIGLGEDGSLAAYTLIDEDGDGIPDGVDTDGDGVIDVRGVGIDEDGDGTYDGFDTDNDGLIDVYASSGNTPTGTGGSPTSAPEEYAVARGLDILFVVDNSITMDDKQALLSQSMPYFMEKLSSLDVGGDIHVGVISSSLGGHGSSQCARDEEGWHNDDQAHLMPSVRADLDEPDFVSWSGEGSATTDEIIASVDEHLAAVGNSGCGFESTLEAWYRFLIDPQPPEEIVIDPSANSATMAIDERGNPRIDTTVLEQRESFLRPDSVVVVIVISDEDDCSAMDGGSYYNNAKFGYLTVDGNFDMPISTPQCETNPNDQCCFSCLQNSPPSGCSAAACDGDDALPPEDDRLNVRCFDRKRRFGVDLLYPVSRYIDALTKHQVIEARTGSTINNPLLVGGSDREPIYRDPNNVIFTGIVGVPWQDVVTEESLNDPSVIELLPASALGERNIRTSNSNLNRWDLVLGTPGIAQSDRQCDVPGTEGCGDEPVPPADPFMIESIAPRDPSLSHPLTGDLIVSATSLSPLANAINGHEANHQVPDRGRFTDNGPVNDDLQLACIFPLETPKVDCTRDDLDCDCGDEPLRNRALCQPPAGGAAGTTQYWGKAYPSRRILQVLQGAEENAIVGSACPKITTSEETDSSYFGYNPFFRALVSEIEARFDN